MPTRGQRVAAGRALSNGLMDLVERHHGLPCAGNDRGGQNDGLATMTIVIRMSIALSNRKTMNRRFTRPAT